MRFNVGDKVWIKSLEEITPAEVYWEQVMPQIKEIVINTYNKGVEIGKAECL